MVTTPQDQTPFRIPEYGLETERGYQLRDYLNVIIKRKAWVIGFFLSIVSLAALYTYTRTPIYRADAILQIVQDNPQSIVGERGDPLMAAMQFGDSTNKFYETQYKLLNSRHIAYNLIDTLKLQDDPEFKLLKNAPPGENVKASIAEILMGNLEINPVKNTFLVEVAYKSADKALAQKIANATYKEYLKFLMETRQQSYSLVKEWLDDELQKLAQKVESSQRKLFDYGQKKETLLEGENDVVVKKFVELNRLLLTAQSERMVKDAQYQQITQKGTDAPGILNNTLILKLRGEVIEQEAKVSGIRKIYGKNYPQFQIEMANLQELRGRLNNELKRAQAGSKAEYEMALRAEHFLQEEYGKQKAMVEKLQQNMVQHIILKRDVQANEALYQGLLARMKEASAASTMIPSNAAVIQPAELPVFPSSPKKARNMGFAIVIGLMGGIGLAFLVEYLDHSIKSVEEVDRLCGLAALGIVPFSSNEARLEEADSILGLKTFENPKSIVAEAINQVNTAVMLSLSGRPPAAILITSPNPSEGKTTLCVNLACSLAMNGRKVVILDADMRRPTLHRIFQQPGQPGLSNFLTGSVALSEIIHATQVPGLFLIPAGAIPPNPVQLLNSEVFRELVEGLRQEFQHLVFDTPPIIGFADARVASCLVDGVILVLKHHTTSREAARLSTHLLSQVNARILGFILNMVHRETMGYGAYYGYHKYYTKYYSDYHDKK